MLHHWNDTLKSIVDAFAAVFSFAALAKVLPVVAAGLSAIWLAVRLFDRWKYGPSLKE